MQTKTSALLLAAFCGFAVLASGSAAAREDTGLEGHWGGDLVSLKTGEKSSAELTLDHYGCYALSIKRDPGIETGFYTVQDGKVVLKTTGGAQRLTFIVEGERLKAEPTPDQLLPKDCCELERR